jgi:hypothetical protein
MSKSMRKQLLLAEIQVSQGVDPTPTAGANAMLVNNITPTPMAAEYVERNNVKPYYGNNSQIAAAIHREITFSVEVAGAGTPGATPAWDPLLRACAFAKTTNASPTEVFYTPISENIPLLTLYYYLDGILWKITDAQGTVSFTLNSRGIPMMNFRFVGEYSTATDTALPAGADYSGFEAPLTVGKVNSQSFQLHGTSPCMEQLSIDMANALTYRDLVGCGGARISDRKPAGTALFELESVATKDWAEVCRTSTSGSFSFVHGRTPGNIVTFEAPAVTCNNFAIQDSEGIAMVSLGLALEPVSGNDELVITVA